MKVITIEEHFTTPNAMKIIQNYQRNLDSYDQKDQDDMNAGMVSATPGRGEMEDVGASRLEYMDKHGIDMQVVSAAGITPQLLPANQAVPLARELNQDLAEYITKNPDRFIGLATLPLDNPQLAAEELAFSVNTLGFRGALISGTVNGKFLDEPEFEIVFATAERLDVPIYMHPGYPTKTEANLLYGSKSYDGAIKSILSTPGFGWHMEAGIQVIRLIFSGIFEKYPNLKIISGHWGEFVPSFLYRLDEMTNAIPSNLKKPFSEYYLNNVYIDPSGIFEYDQLLFSLNRIGADHIMWAEDYPFVKTKQAESFLQNAPISQQNKEKIAHSTAEKIFKIK